MSLHADFFHRIDFLEQSVNVDLIAQFDGIQLGLIIDLAALETVIQADQNIEMLFYNSVAVGHITAANEYGCASTVILYRRAGDSHSPSSGFEVSIWSRAQIDRINDSDHSDSNNHLNVMGLPISPLISLKSTLAIAQGSYFYLF